MIKKNVIIIVWIIIVCLGAKTLVMYINETINLEMYGGIHRPTNWLIDWLIDQWTGNYCVISRLLFPNFWLAHEEAGTTSSKEGATLPDRPDEDPNEKTQQSHVVRLAATEHLARTRIWRRHAERARYRAISLALTRVDAQTHRHAACIIKRYLRRHVQEAGRQQRGPSFMHSI